MHILKDIGEKQLFVDSKTNLQEIVQAEEKQKTVQEADAGDERAGTVHEKDDSSDSHSGGKKRSADSNSSDNAGDTDRDSEIIRDPALGNKVDISG